MRAVFRSALSLSIAASRSAGACIFFAMALSSSLAVAQPVDATTRDRYTLRARLDPERREVIAHASIRWRNRTRVALRELLFHLYPNAFANNGTVFMREEGPRQLPLTRPGGIDLRRLRLEDGSDLLADSDRELIKGDATQLRVELPRPLAAGAWITLEIDFRVRLPAIVARMGAEHDFFMIAQWFPKLARVTPDGEFRGFPYHGLGEFDADFSDYELEVEVPDEYVIAAPGDRVAREAGPGGVRVERYRHENALDVAWAAYPRFVVSTRITPRARIEVYAAPGGLRLAQREAEWLELTLARLSTRLGAYPYRRLVLVLPPRFARGAAGMEYPGLIVGWVIDARADATNPIQALIHDDVTAHELAHEWFPMTVTSNELEMPMLDEGLAQWLGLDLMRERYGRPYFARLLGLPLDMFEILRVRGLGADSALQPAYRYRSAAQLGADVYNRPALVLETIARSYGRLRLDAALLDYARTHRFAHVSFDDLWVAFDRTYGAGFSARVLRPALEATPVASAERGSDDPDRKRVIDVPQPTRAPADVPHARPLYARLLFLVTALLSEFGP